MSFPRYPECLESGVPWLGALPVHWELRRVRQLFEIRKRIAGELGHDVLSVTQQGLKVKDIESNDGQLSMDYSKYQLVRVGEFVMNHMDLLTGYVDVALMPGVTSPDYRVFAVRDAAIASPRYLLYLFQMGFKNKIFFAYGQGSSQLGRWRLPTDQFNELPFPLPPIAEQIVIANFLDREATKIDALVAEQRRLMELLKEKRQAVISHAVTKGLDPEAPMKPSGIEWLGEIPSHWEMRRLKHISSFVTVGIVVEPSSYISEEGRPFIYGGDIREGVIDWRNARRIDDDLGLLQSKTRLKAGDLLTVRVGAPGVTAVVSTECDGGNCASVMLIRQGAFNSQWLCYAMNDRVVRFQVEVVQYGAAQEQFNISHAVNFWIPMPPRSEQDEIVEFLAAETQSLDALTAEAQRAIDLLQERRTALISAAVTGQIDVRQTPSPTATSSPSLR